VRISSQRGEELRPDAEEPLAQVPSLHGQAQIRSLETPTSGTRLR
jgi:hypothetical protein